MRVLMAARWPVGGIRTFLRDVYSQFCFERFEITLLAPNHALGEFLGRHIPRHRLETICVSGGQRALFHGIRRFLQRGAFELLHTHGLSTGVMGEIASVGTRVPHLLTLHDVFLPNTFAGVNGWLKPRALSVVLRRCEGIHAVGDDCAANLMEYFPAVRRERVHSVRNGIDTDRFYNARRIDAHALLGLPTETVLIGFFGRFMAQKGFRTLVDAVELMVRGGFHRPLRVITFGSGGFVREDYDYIRRKGLSEFFAQHPHTDEPERSMKAMDVIAIPSKWEACPLQPMEALCRCTPIVGTDAVGLRKVLAQTPAVSVPVGDARKLAEALVATLAEGVRKRFREFCDEAQRR